ncbi:MAG: hypothetical protein U0Q11_18910 [Vicinamibacterales bacterium]
MNNYLKQMERVTRRFFYHENPAELHFDIEHYDFENFTADFFQVPESFTRLFSAPSRWPFFGPESPHHHFTENLFLNTDPAFRGKRAGKGPTRPSNGATARASTMCAARQRHSRMSTPTR